MRGFEDEPSAQSDMSVSGVDGDFLEGAMLSDAKIANDLSISQDVRISGGSEDPRAVSGHW